MKILFTAIACFCVMGLPQYSFSEQREIEEIIVTATKREESIQDVPIAVSAFSGEDLAARGVQDLYGLQEVSPSIAVYSSNSTSNGGTLRIRGVGTTGNNPGLEAAVGTFIDGVYRSRAGLAFSDMVDIERVEILRGPQGTLFGKNTVAGAVSIISKKPEFLNNYSVNVGTGSFDAISYGGMANVVLSEDQLAGRITFQGSQRDGFYKDIDSGDGYDDRDRYSVKGQLLFTPNDNVEARLIVDYTDRDETCCPAAFYIAGPTSAIIEGLGGDIREFSVDGKQEVGLNFKPYEDVEDKGVSLDVLWHINKNWSARSVTAYREYKVNRGQDIDFTSADVLVPQDSHESFENFSQEFQLFGGNEAVDWLFGAYVYTEDLVSDEVIALSVDGPAYVSQLIMGLGNNALAPFFEGDPAGRGLPAQGYDAIYASDTKGWSVFTHNTWHATSVFDLTLGLRYSWEEKDATSIINGAPIGGTPIDDPFCAAIPIGSLCDNQSWSKKEDESELTGTVKVAYHVNDEVSVYASYGRGYKAGGFNLDQEAMGNRDPDTGEFVDESHFEPETSDAYELGLKARFFDRTFTINAALFYTDFENFQLNTFTGLGFTVGNVKAVRTKGIEVESFWTVGDGIFLTAGVTLADAKYGSNLSEGNAAVEGKRLTQSPKWQSSASLFVDKPLPGSDNQRWTFSLNWSHIGKVNTGSDLDPEKVRSAFDTINSQIGIGTADGRYAITLWGRNLTDKRMNTLVFDSVFQAGSWHTFLNQPRMWGITAKSSF